MVIVMKEKNIKTYIYSIIVVLSFVLVAVGTSLAIVYYKVNGNDNNGNIDVKTSYVNAMFENGNDINDENILPGWSNRLEFSITNISEELNAVGRYTLIMNVEKNELDSNNFVYNIVGTSTLDGVELEEAQYTNIVVNRPSFEPVPTISTTLGNGVINTGVKHNYVLTFKFNENGENQDEFQGKTFKANVVAKGE